MMKWLLIFALLWIVLNVANNALKNRGASDSDMRKVTEDLNKRMPMVRDVVRVEHADYANRRILFTGKVIEGQMLNEEWNANLRAHMVSFYCSNEVLSKSKVVFAYSYDQVALRNINDKLKRENLSGEVSGAAHLNGVRSCLLLRERFVSASRAGLRRSPRARSAG